MSKPTGTTGAGRKPETPVVTVDEQQLRHSAIVASTFANLQLMTTKETLTQYSGLYQAAKEDLTRVNEEMVERDRDNIKVVDHLRSQNKETTERMKKQKAELEQKIEAQKIAFQQEKEALNALLREKDRQIEKLNAVVDQQQADLDSLNAFKRERHDIHAEISNYKQRQAEIAIEHEQEMSKVKFAALEERVKLKAEERLMRERFEADVSDQAAAMLDAKTRTIHAENTQLQQDKVLQQQEIDQLTKENRMLKAKSNEQQRELDLSKGAEKEFSQRCARQNIENKETKKQIQTLEQNLSQVIETYEMKLRTVSDVSTSELGKLQTERDSAYRNAEGRQKELLKLRAVAKQVVNQRTELEMFFHEALAFVRKEILAERAESNKQLQLQAQQEHLLRIKGSPTVSTSPAKESYRQTRSQLHQFLPKEKLTVSKSQTNQASGGESQHQLLFSPYSPVDSGVQSPNTSRSAVFQCRSLKAPVGASFNVSSGASTARRGENNQRDHMDVVGTARTSQPPLPPTSAPAASTATDENQQPSSSVPTLPAIGRTSSVASSASSLMVLKNQPAHHELPSTFVRPQPQQQQLAGYMATTASNCAKKSTVSSGLPVEEGASDPEFVDIADLSWTDKERVLRILFAKINSRDQKQSEVVTPTRLLEAPPQHLESNTPIGGTLSNSTPNGPKRYLKDVNSTTFFTQ